MPKYCYNYDSGEYEYIDEDGYSGIVKKCAVGE